MSPLRPIHLVITMGDPNGIGPELALRATAHLADQPEVKVMLTGEAPVYRWYASALSLDATEIREVGDWTEVRSESINVLASDKAELAFGPEPGELSEEGGRLAMNSVMAAVDQCISGGAHGMITAPFSKEAVQLAGFDIPGHTEFIAQRTGAADPLMMMVADTLRLGLVTAHISLRDVAYAITQETIQKKLRVLRRSLQTDFGIKNPQIAVLGLNPHAGDGGMMGREELDIIRPAIDAFNESGGVAIGPLPADGFFGLRKDKQFDAVLCMYHDQGLAPFKALAFDSGVNFTAGLPIVRTSPVHGTAFDIAGKGEARLGSMLAAIHLARDVAEQRALSEETFSSATESP